MSEHKPVTVLLVEDDPGHAVLIERNLRRAGIANEIIAVDNGRKAVDFLFKENGSLHEHRPDSLLILLDLNMPVMNGFQVLEAVRKNERTRQIPIVVLTTTDNPQEINRCYELGCNVYITKPVEYEKFCEAIRNLGLFLSIVKLPEKG